MSALTTRGLRPRRTGRGRGFTLLEMMLVVVIIGMLATVAVIAIGSRARTAKIETTKVKLKTIESQLDAYQVERGSFPQSLSALVPGYLKTVPKDAWKRDFVYSLTPVGPNQPFTLYSLGESEEDPSDDISVWTIE
jgi:general secretion pathway protein G